MNVRMSEIFTTRKQFIHILFDNREATHFPSLAHSEKFLWMTNAPLYHTQCFLCCRRRAVETSEFYLSRTISFILNVATITS